MNKAGILCLSLVMSVLAGCSAASKPSKEEPVMTAASECSDQVFTASEDKTGTTNFKSIFKNDATIIRVGDSSYKTQHIQGLPYVESTALDKGKPGSAWRSCMQGKGFTVGG